jgi:hypothetical protein
MRNFNSSNTPTAQTEKHSVSDRPSFSNLQSKSMKNNQAQRADFFWWN